MRISAAGLALIRQSEGFRSTAYKDVSGNVTIGYGHRIVRGESFPATLARAKGEALLLSDVAKAEQQLAALVHVTLTQGQFDALVDFIYNLGSERLASSTLLRDINAGQFAQAASQLLLWDHAGTEVLPGLKARREAEFRLFTGSAQANTPTAA